MRQIEVAQRVSDALEGFVYGLRLADPKAGFGTSEVFDSAFWGLFSLLEGDALGTPLLTSLSNRLDILLDSLYLDAETRSALQDFRDTGLLSGSCTSEGSQVLPRVLGVALCETSVDRRVELSSQLAAITHLSPVVVQASIAVAELFAALLSEDTVADPLAQACAVVDHPEVRSALAAHSLLPVEVSDDCGVGGRDPVVDVVRWVVWALLNKSRPDVLDQVLKLSNSDPVAVSLVSAALAASGASSCLGACQDLRSHEIAEQVMDCRVRRSSI